VNNSKDKNRPKISVITTTYNASATIEQALLTVANQRYEPLEHLIIDGLSEDNTVSIVEKYQKKFPHIRMVSQKDKGIYDAMNKGIDLSCGDWLFFLGADDVLYNENVFNELYDEGYLSKKEVVYGNVLVVGDTSWAKDGTLYDGRFDLHKLFRNNICHQAIFYPAEIVKETGYFNMKYFISADWDFNIRCYAKKEFRFVDKIIAKFTGGGTSSAGGVDGIGADLPEIIVKNFRLNTDIKQYDPSSPFYSMVERYKKKSLIDKILLQVNQKLLRHS